MYSIKKVDGKEYNTAKGVSIAIEFNKFEDVLFNKKFIRYKMKRIQSKKYKLGTYEIDKISLSFFDDKRFALDDEFHTLPYFHKDLKKKKILTDYHKQEEIQKVHIKKRDSYR